MPDRLTTRPKEPSPEAVARAPLLLPPLNAVLELALFVLVIVALDWYLPSFDLSRVEPNPCWLPVLLLAVQYGTVSGLLAAAICIGLTVHMGFPEQEIGENLFVYLLRAWAQPMLWIAAAVLLGQFRTRHIVERAELRLELATLSSQRTSIADHARNLRQRCDALERHIAGRSGHDPIRLLALLMRLGGEAAGDTGTAFRKCMSAALPSAKVTLARVGPGGLEMIATSPEARDRRLEGIDASTPFLRELIARRRPLSVMSAHGEQLLAGHALVAVPIEAADEVAGVILVHEIEPQALTSDLPEALVMIGAAFAPALGALHGAAAKPGADGTVDRHAVVQPLLKRLWRPWQRAEPAKAAAAAGTRTPAKPQRMLR